MSSCISQYCRATQHLGFVFVRETFIAISTSVSGKEYNTEALESGKLSIKGKQVVQLWPLPTE